MQTFLTENGEYALLLGPKGKLREDALPRFLQAAKLGADFIFADEAVLTDSGAWEAVHKPVYSPDTMLSFNAVGFPLALRRSLYEACCPVDPSDPASYYAFVLRAAAQAAFIYHIPETLRWGERLQHPQEPKLLDRAVCAMGRDGYAVDGLTRDTFGVRYGVPSGLLVSVVVRGANPAAIRVTLESAELYNTYRDVEFLVAYTGIPTLAGRRYFSALAQNGAARVFWRGGGEDSVQSAIEEAHGSMLLLIDAGIAFACYDGIERMVELCRWQGNGVVGGKLITREKQIVQAGLALGISTLPVSLYTGVQESFADPVQNHCCHCIRNVSAASRVLLVERGLFFETGGFDKSVPVCARDAAFCTVVGRRRYNVYTPYARFFAAPCEKPELTQAEKKRVDDVFRPFRMHGDPMLCQDPSVIAAYLRQAEKNHSS